MKLRIQFVSGPGLSRRSLVSGPRALDVGPRPLSVPGPSALCVGARRSRGALVSRPSTLSLICVGPLCPSAPPTSHPCATYPVPRVPSSDPRATQPAAGPQLRSASIRSAGPQLRSACQREPPAQIPIQPGAFPFSRREPQTLLFGGKGMQYGSFNIHTHIHTHT